MPYETKEFFKKANLLFEIPKPVDAVSIIIIVLSWFLSSAQDFSHRPGKPISTKTIKTIFH